MVEASERAIEFLARIIGKARAIALDEAVTVTPPFAGDADREVEFGRTDLGQKAGFQHFGDEPPAGGGDFRSFESPLTQTPCRLVIVPPVRAFLPPWQNEQNCATGGCRSR